MSYPSPFKWRHFEANIILCREWDVLADHATAFRWVQRNTPQLDRRCRVQLQVSNASYREDETYICITRPSYDLYRAIDSTGATLDFTLSPSRNVEVAAEHFLHQVLQTSLTLTFRMIPVDRDAALTIRLRESAAGEDLPGDLPAPAL